MSQSFVANTSSKIDIERMDRMDPVDLDDLCDAADAAIEAGGGFGWLSPPERWKMENFWNGVTLMPERTLWVARLDDVISGSIQLQRMPKNNEAQQHMGRVQSMFVAPWARGKGLSELLIDATEQGARAQGLKVLCLDIRATQETAIAVTERAGFERVGTNPYYAQVGGQWVAGHYYYKLLTA